MKSWGLTCLALWPALALAAVPREQLALGSFEVTGHEANAALKGRLRASLIAGLSQSGYDVVDPPGPKRSKQLHVKVAVVGSSNFEIAVELRDAEGKPLAKVNDSCQVCTIAEACDAVLAAPALLRMKRAEPASQEATARAKEHYRKGELAFQIGNFNEAAQHFQESYAEAPVPKLLWNIAQALRRQYEIDHDLAKLRRAAAVLRNFRSSGGEDEDTAKVTREINDELARAEAEQKKPAVVVDTTPQVITTTTTPDKPPAKKPLYKHWGLWAGVGAAAGAALIIGLGVGLSSSHENFWANSQATCTTNCSLLDLR